MKVNYRYERNICNIWKKRLIFIKYKVFLYVDKKFKDLIKVRIKGNDSYFIKKKFYKLLIYKWRDINVIFFFMI